MELLKRRTCSSPSDLTLGFYWQLHGPRVVPCFVLEHEVVELSWASVWKRQIWVFKSRLNRMFVVPLFQATGLHFRHTDNVIQWLNAMSEKGLPKVSHTHTHHWCLSYTNFPTIEVGVRAVKGAICKKFGWKQVETSPKSSTEFGEITVFMLCGNG